MTDIQAHSAISPEVQSQDPAPAAKRGFRGIFLGLVRFTDALFGIGLVGEMVLERSPGFLGPLAFGAGALAVFALIRPLPYGWLNCRSAMAGLLLGAYVVMEMPSRDRSEEEGEKTLVSASRTVEADTEITPKIELSKAAPTKKKTPVAAISDPLDDANRQSVWIDISKEAVRNRLRDPSSATFRSVVFNASPGKALVVCGEVSGKNGFGGTSGYQGFVASGDKLVFLESDFGAGEFPLVWNELCLK